MLPPSDRPTEERPRSRSRTFFRVRVAVLLAILAGVLLYAWRDVRSRALRNDWTRTLDVALVVVAADLDPDLAAALRARAEVLEDVLAAEMERHRSGGPRPFDVEVAVAPVALAAPAPPEEGLAEAARFAWDLHGFTSAADDAAALAGRHDARIYLLARPPSTSSRRRAIEGLGQQGGRIGVIEVELDETMVDLALFVATHELMHTLGAGDRYDTEGHPLVPEGLADPERVPLFPQEAAEIMARHRAVTPHRSVPPESLDELVVGDATAHEIGWRGAP